LAVNILKNSSLPLPQELMTLTAQTMLEDDSMLALFLEALKQTHDILNFNQVEQPTPRKHNLPPQP
jgi:hypothetical protein